MENHATTTYGLDLGDKKSVICVLDADGEVVEEARVTTSEHGFTHYFQERAPARVVMEVGGHSPWVSRLLEELGHEVLVANARRVKLISQNHRKGDQVDAEFLARLGRVDPQLLAPIHHRGQKTQTHLVVVRARAAMVRVRTTLIVSARNTVKSLGLKIPSSSCASFYRRAMESLPEELRESLLPMLESIKKLSQEIRACEQRIQKLCETEYPETARLMGVNGVGFITALTFVLLIEDPSRFRNARAVGAYLGLAPKRRQSGDSDPKLGISKIGDSYMRALLTQCAQYILGPFGQDSALKRKGLRIVEGGGKGAKKRAVVAVARTLACVLFHLLVSNERYRPFPDGKPADLDDLKEAA